MLSLPRTIDERGNIDWQECQKIYRKPSAECSRAESRLMRTMVNKRSRAARARKNKRRSRLYLALSDREVQELDRAVAESGSLFRGIVITASVYAGLAKGDFSFIQQKRLRRVYAWVPKEIPRTLKQVASANHVTRQVLLRHFLFQYLSSAPWNQTDTIGAQNQGGRSEEITVP